MGSLIAFLLAKGVSERFARPLAYLAVAIALGGLLGLAKWGYDRSVIRKYEAPREAAIARADRKADAVVAITRRADDARLVQETTQLKKVEANAHTVTDRRLARHRCLRLQQAARRERRKPPTCG